MKPKNLLLSYYYFKNKDLKSWVNNLGYTPNILLDSGAYTAYNKKITISMSNYIKYIENNISVLQKYISLDVLGDTEKSYWNWKEMKSKLPNAIPVFHYKQDEIWLQKYIEEGATTIALGGTVPVSNKITIIKWIDSITPKYPDIKFHLLGSCSKKILNYCQYIDSCDSSSWIMMAVNGKPKEIEGVKAEDKTIEAKMLRAKYWMRFFDDEIEL